MQLVLNIDDELFKSSDLGTELNKIIHSVSNEDLKIIVKDILKEYMMKDDVIKNYFTETNFRYSGPSSLGPSLELKKIINQIDFSEEMKDVKEKYIKILNEDIREILIGQFAQAYARAFSNLITEDRDFSNRINSSIYRALSTVNNK